MQDQIPNSNEREPAIKIRQSIESWIMYTYPYKNLIKNKKNRLHELEYINLPESKLLRKARLDRMAAMESEIKKEIELSVSIDIERIDFIKKYMEEHQHITEGNCSELHQSLSASLYWFTINLEITDTGEVTNNSYNYEKISIEGLKRLKEKFLSYFEEVQYINHLQGKVEILPEKILQSTPSEGGVLETSMSDLFTPSIKEFQKSKSSISSLIKFATGTSESQKSMIEMVANNFKGGEQGIDAWLRELNKRVEFHNAESLPEVNEARKLYEEALIIYNDLPKRIISLNNYRKKLDVFINKYQSFIDKCKTVFMILENNQTMQQIDSSLGTPTSERKK